VAKLGIIVPYRDREEHLSRFIPEIESHLEKTSIDDYEVFVVNQDNELPFKLENKLHIPKETYHRLIKGTGDLKVKIFKLCQ